MYCPYLRGRQYELIALREMLERSTLSPKVLPVIEPVTLSPTLLSTLETFIQQNRPIIVIRNPQVEKFVADLARQDYEKRRDQFFQLLQNNLIRPGHLMVSFFERKETSYLTSPDLAVIMNNFDQLNHYNRLFIEKNPRYTFVPYALEFRRGLRGKGSLILFKDGFPKKDRNKDYAASVDNAFSSDHLYFREEGYGGFADYSIVGGGFSDTGFSPRAVVIHMVYFGSQQELRIHHYVSDSNDNIKDPAGKFSEALEKLINCPYLKGYDTAALKVLKRHYAQGTYPGLGVLKKLSIMHHLELMGEFLNGG